MKKCGKWIAGVPAAVLCAVGHAQAAITLPTSMDVGDVETLAGLVLTGLAVIWGVRKLIKMTNRS